MSQSAADQNAGVAQSNPLSTWTTGQVCDWLRADASLAALPNAKVRAGFDSLLAEDVSGNSVLLFRESDWSYTLGGVALRYRQVFIGAIERLKAEHGRSAPVE